MKKIHKRIFSLFLAVVMAFSLLPATAWAYTGDLDTSEFGDPVGTATLGEGTGLQYTLYVITKLEGSTFTLVISKEDDASEDDSFQIPNYAGYDEVPWSGNMHLITNVYIQDGVKGIGSYAFAHDPSIGDNLSYIEIPSSVNFIGDYAFANHTLAAFDDDGDGAGDTALDLSNVTQMGDHAFYNCDTITSVTLNGQLNCGLDAENEDYCKIPAYAFYGCNLTDFTLEGTSDITAIGAYAFAGNRLTSVSLPEGVTTIEERAFSANNAISSISLPNSLVTIGDYAFYCALGAANENLQSLTIPENVTSIGAWAFHNYQGLATVKVDSAKLTGNDAVKEGAFGKDQSNAYHNLNGTIEDDVTGETITGLVLGTEFQTPNDGVAAQFRDGYNCYAGDISPLTLVEAQEPTCEARGVNTYHLTIGNQTITVYRYVPALGHLMAHEDLKEQLAYSKPTCESNGYYYDYCTRENCDHIVVDRYVENTQLTHNYDVTGLTNPTVASGRNTVITYTCQNGDAHTDQSTKSYQVTLSLDAPLVITTTDTLTDALLAHVTVGGGVSGSLVWAEGVDKEPRGEGTYELEVVFKPSVGNGIFESVSGYNGETLKVQVNVEKATLNFANTTFAGTDRYVGVNNPEFGVQNPPDGATWQKMEWCSTVAGSQWTTSQPSDTEQGDYKVRVTFSYEEETYQVSDACAEGYELVDNQNGTVTLTTDYTVRLRTMSNVQANAITPNKTYTGQPLETVRASGMPTGTTITFSWEEGGQTKTESYTATANQAYYDGAKITAAGNYTVTVTFALEGYGTETRTVPVTVNKATVELPEIATASMRYYQGYTYTGVQVDADSSQYNYSGTYQAVDAGTYTVTLTLEDADNYRWGAAPSAAANRVTINGGTAEIRWMISKAPVVKPTLYPEHDYTYQKDVVRAPVMNNSSTQNWMQGDDKHDVQFAYTPAGDGTNTLTATYYTNRTGDILHEEIFKVTQASATDTGDYTAAATLTDDNYYWVGEEESLREIEVGDWSIAKRSITNMPTVTARTVDYTSAPYLDENVSLDTNNTWITSGVLTLNKETPYLYYRTLSSTARPTTPVNAGTYYVFPQFDYDAENYNLPNYYFGSGGYYATFTINKVTLSVTGPSKTEYTYTGAEQTIEGVAVDPSGLKGNDTASAYTLTYTSQKWDKTLNGGEGDWSEARTSYGPNQLPVLTDVGKYRISVTLTATNYQATIEPYEVNIQSANQTVKLEGAGLTGDGTAENPYSITKTLGNETFAVTGKGYVGDTVVNEKNIRYEVTASAAADGSENPVVEVDGNSGAVTLLRAGTATVTVTAAASGNYGEATASYTITVGRGTPTVAVQLPTGGTGEDKNIYSYTGQKREFGAEVTGATGAVPPSTNAAGSITYTFYRDNSGVKGEKLSGQPTGVGTYWVVATYKGDDNYQEAASELIQFTISASTLNVTINGHSGVYDGSTHDVATVSSVTGVGKTFSESDYRVTFIEKGEDEGTAPTADDARWTASPVTGVKDVAHSGGYWYKVEVTGADKDNYAPFISSVTVEIRPKRLEVTNTITPRKTYDGTIKATVTFNSINTGIPGETVTAEVTSASYNSADVEKANSITIAYKLTPKEGTNLGNYTLNGTDPITEEAASLSQTVTKVGDTPVGIDPASITVDIKDQKKVYDGTVPAITAPVQGTHWSTKDTIYSQGGVKDNLDITLTVGTSGSDAVGEYAITGAAANTNYDVTFTGSWDGDGVKGQAGTYEVTPRPVEVAIGDALGYYGDDPVLTGVDLTYSKVDGNDNSGLVDDSVPLNLQSNATASSDAGGTYAIYATSNDQRIPLNRATDIDNYRVTVTKDGTYTQQARPITVTALLHSSDYGCPIDGGIANPIKGTDYTVTLGTGPAAGGEAIIGEDLAVSLETNATSTSPVGGSYTITPEVTAKEGKLDNYDVIMAGAAYTINQAQVSFLFAEEILRVNYGTPAQNAITFYNESNGHTAITDSNDIEALQNALQFPQSEEYTITKDGTVTIHNAGVVASVTATLGASANFKAADAGDQFTIIGNQSELVVNVQPVNGLTYTGQPQGLVRLTTANLPASVKVYYSTDTGENKQWSEEIPTATNAGEHTVYWKFEDTSGQYVGAGTVHEVTAAIAKADLTASFRNSTPSFTIGDYTSYGEAQNPLTFSPDTEYDKSQITYKSSNPYVAVIDDEHVHQLTIVGTGTTTITATIPGDANRNEATVHYTLTVDASGGMSASAQNVNVPYDGIPHSIAVIVTGAENYTIRYYAAEGNVEQYPSGYPEEENPSFTNAGTYTVFYQVTAPNATARTGRAIITILPRSIDANMVQGIDDEYTYSGNQITPIPTVTDIIDGQQVTLRENVDYTVEYGTNQAVGSGTVTIKGMGNYGGKVEKTFTIRAVDSGEVTASLSSYYGSLDDDPTGAETTVSVKHGSHDVGFTITGVSPEAGTSVGADGKTITFTAHGVYTITVKAGDEQHAEREFTLRYMLMPRTSAGGLSVALADGLPQVITYGDRFVTSGSIVDSIEVKDSNGTPLDTDDYNLTCVYYENPDSDDQGSAAVTVDLDGLNGVPAAGMYVVTATGTGSYSPNLSGTFTFLVLQRNLSDSAIDWTVSDSGLTYDAAEQVLDQTQITADFKDADGNPVTVEFAIDDYSNNINAGTDTAYVILQAPADSNNFTGTVSVPFSIGKRPITDDANFTITVPDEVSISAGGEARPEVTIYDEVLGRPLTNQDFAVSYSNNDKAGTATVTITGTGNYTGEVPRTFTVVVTSTTFDLTIDKTSWTYGDTANRATSITVTNGGDTLTIGTDYTLFISKDGGTAQEFTDVGDALAYLDRPGTYTVTATGTGSYSFTESETVTISKAQLALEITVTPDTKAGSGTAQIQVKSGTWPAGIDATQFTTLTVQKNGTAQNSLTLTYDAATGAYQPVSFSFGNETVTYTFGVMETEIQNFDPDCYELTITGGRLSVVEQTNNGGGGGGGGTPTAYTITASAGTGGLISPEGTVAVARGDDQSFAIRAADGYHVEEVLVDGKSVGAVTSYTFENVTRNHTIAVTFARGEEIADPDDTGVSDWLNTKDHFAYLNGYGNGLFGPNDNMTRAEAAQMFYNLLLNQNVPVTASFSDVPADAWYARAVNTLASLGIINGVGDNRYEPTRTITRAEFTVIAMRFAHLATDGENIFSDVDPGDWFYDEVVGSIQYGWINGYEDGTFRPNNTITRAEVAAITNRMLGRSADEEYVDAHTAQLRTFGDLRGSYWAYYEIVEATNGHDYETTEGTENWTALAD